MADPTAFSYIITNALPGGIAIAMAANGSVFTNSGLENQHVWRFKLVDASQGILSISNGQSAITASNSVVNGAGSGSGTNWKITPLDVHGYVAHTIQETGVSNPRYWVLNPNHLGPGSQVELRAKPPGAPDLHPAALWVFTSITGSGLDCLSKVVLIRIMSREYMRG
ncbi:hypothetical protein BD779DRAFT_1788332 [Infundibulicybe gibba]|nr:hypothetical protein BD779DRAFT_1788332 [Infundibulicybe gibba]